ncbi:sodium:calcium antiporter [Candidatus Arthromitus sp. SFB-rat-Yit]|uniref:sodium:calcium antiporter n=1 Tax=Candidatus Arthromitus sp. SFB-rat-Yit TaxID=1041504 RepID=UPI0002DE30E4|nr:cation transporter [Candidatus Arthromitus sp. SFB-rat-Yit]
MVYLIYIILAIAVIVFSIKAADYVDLIDKKTNISGAFIGGVVLAAVTSLPELFTSISGALILNNSEIVLGNILGSNIFNLATLSVIVILFIRGFVQSQISKSHTKITMFIIVINIILFLPAYFSKDFNIFNISVVSILVSILYFTSLKFMATNDIDGGQDGEEDEENSLTLKQIFIRFILSSIGLVIASIAITYVTDIISIKLNLAASLSGALFLGIATSLPEVTSCLALAKKSKFNLVVGNIIGSNMFNLFIISIIDLLYTRTSLYFTNHIQTKILLLFGFIATIFIAILLIVKNSNKKLKFVYLLLSLASILTYFLYLILSL